MAFKLSEHIVVNPHVLPKKIVTVFFDRKARRQK